MEFIPQWAIGVAVVLAAFTVARAVSGGIRSSRRRLQASDPEAGDLRETVDALQRRLGELEERVDFAERLLAKK